MPPLHLRQEFPTLKAFKEALHAWAIEAHFEPRILKSDTGRVRVGCKRDPNCPFVIRCNWERKGGREPLARVTVLRERHTCLNALEWRDVSVGGQEGRGMGNGDMAGNGGGLEIRQDAEGNIVGGARVLGPISPRPGANGSPHVAPPAVIPVLPKVQRNSASRLPFLMDILPKLMVVNKETTPVEIRECLLREYGAEVHLQQCRRAKTEILKRMVAVQGMQEDADAEGEGDGGEGQSADGIGSDAGEGNTGMFGNDTMSPHQTPVKGAPNGGMNGGMNGGPNLGNPPPQGDGRGDGREQHDFRLHTASGVVIPQMPSRSEAALSAVSEPPIRCPFCVNHRWMRSIKDAVEHMSMHVVVS